MSAVIRGHHVYKDSWIQEGETLDCVRELTNLHDPYTVSVMKNSLFLRTGSLHCIVTGKRRYSRDVPQGRLEIPGILVFTGDVDKTHKVEKIDQF